MKSACEFCPRSALCVLTDNCDHRRHVLSFQKSLGVVTHIVRCVAVPGKPGFQWTAFEFEIPVELGDKIRNESDEESV